MTFLEPALLILLLVIIPVFVVVVFMTLRGNTRLQNFISQKRWHDLLIGYSSKRRIIKVTFAGLAAVFLVLTIARPSWGNREQKVVDRGLDILIALDISQSMMAEDVAPNRLEHAKSQIRQLLSAIPGNRVGLMPFAGDAYVMIPITSDYEFVSQNMENLTANSIRTPGTNFNRALEVADLAFDRGAIGTKILLFITDGENHADGLDYHIQQAKDKEIRIYAIGLGSSDGSEITVKGQRLLDPSTNQPVLSRLDQDTLRIMASETDGEAYVSTTGARIDINPLIRDIQYLESVVGAEKSATRYIPEERFQFPLALALLFLLLDGMVASAHERKGRKVVTA